VEWLRLLLMMLTFTLLLSTQKDPLAQNLWNVTVSATVWVNEEPAGDFYLELGFSEPPIAVQGYTAANGTMTVSFSIAAENLRWLQLRDMAFQGRWFLASLGVNSAQPYEVPLSPTVSLSPQDIGQNVSRYILNQQVEPLKVDTENRRIYFYLTILLTQAGLFRLGFVNPFTGTASGLSVLQANWIPVQGLGWAVTSLGNMGLQARVRVQGVADRAAGEVYKDFVIDLHDVPLSEAVDLTPYMAEALTQGLKLNAEHCKQRLQSMYLWTEQDEERFSAITFFISIALKAFREVYTYRGVYMMREALRLLLCLQDRLSLEIRFMYVLAPITNVLLVFFAFFLARLLTEERWRRVSIILYLAMFVVFMKVHPYIGISLWMSLQDLPLLAEMFLPSSISTALHWKLFLASTTLVFTVGVPSLILLVLVRHRGVTAYSILEQAIRGIKLRRLKFTLALIAVVLVSFSFLISSSAFAAPAIFERNLTAGQLGLALPVEHGVTVLKFRLDYYETPESLEPGGHVVSLHPAEAEWLLTTLNREGLEASLLGFRKVVLEGEASQNMLNLIALNLSYALKYWGLAEALEPRCPSPSGPWVIMGRKALENRSVMIGDYVRVDGKAMRLVGVFDEEKVRGLKDIDGFPLFGGVDIHLITSVEAFQPYEFMPMKISMVFTHADSEELRGALEKILDIGIDVHSQPMGRADVTINHVVGFTYLIHVVEGSSVKQMLLGNYAFQVIGSWPSQMVIVSIGASIIFTTATAVIYERKREVRTMTSLGASPSFIAFLLVYEGAIFGVVGGVFAYCLGYIVVWVFNLLSPRVFLAMPLGPFHMILAILVAVLTSVLGYLIPARGSVRLVIPSGLLNRGMGRVLTQSSTNVVVDIPLRVKISEQSLLRTFLMGTFPSLFPQVGFFSFKVGRISEKVVGAKTEYRFEGASVPSGTATVVPLTMVVDVEKEGQYLMLTLTVESPKLYKFSKVDLRDAIIEIRGNLLQYIDWKTKRTKLERKTLT